MNFTLHSIFIYTAILSGPLFSSAASAHTKAHDVGLMHAFIHNFSHLSPYSGLLITSAAIIALALSLRRQGK